MSWDYKGYAATLYLCDLDEWARSPGDLSAFMRVGNLVQTSTSTIEIQTESSDGATTTRARTFNVTSATIQSSIKNNHRGHPYLAYVAPQYFCMPTRPTLLGDEKECSGQRIGFVDSGYHAAPLDASLYDVDLHIVADNNGHGYCTAESGTTPAFGNYPATETSIPTTKRQCTVDRVKWRYDYIDGFTPGWEAQDFVGQRWGTASYTTSEDYFAVTYKDPHVIKVPGEDRWIMFLARYRIRESDIASDVWSSCYERSEGCSQADSTGFFDTNNPHTGRCIADVVAYVSDNADFSLDKGTVAGPYLMVDSLEAVPEVQVRFWLGVPGATFAEDEGEEYLYLYYIVEPDHGYGTDEGPYVDVLTPGDGTANKNYYMDQLKSSALEVSYLNGILQPGLWVKRIKASVLKDFFDSSGSTDESQWTKDSAVSGDLLGKVGLWAVEPNAIGEFGSLVAGVGTVESLSRYWTWFAVLGFQGPVNSLVTPRIADPCPVECGDGRMALFFSVAPSLENEDPTQNIAASSDDVPVPRVHGIWHAMSVPTGARLAFETRAGPVTVEALFGKTFVVNMQVDPANGRYKDQVYEATATDLAETNRQFTPSDPDAFLTLSGFGTSAGVRVYFTGLRVADGDSADVCYDYTSAWTSVEGACNPDGPLRPPEVGDQPRGLLDLMPWLAPCIDRRCAAGMSEDRAGVEPAEGARRPAPREPGRVSEADRRSGAERTKEGWVDASTSARGQARAISAERTLAREGPVGPVGPTSNVPSSAALCTDPAGGFERCCSDCS
ncbi:MAG: hypothetical protein ACOZNI_18500 [Myxococcota bacterium]